MENVDDFLRELADSAVRLTDNCLDRDQNYTKTVLGIIRKIRTVLRSIPVDRPLSIHESTRRILLLGFLSRFRSLSCRPHHSETSWFDHSYNINAPETDELPQADALPVLLTEIPHLPEPPQQSIPQVASLDGDHFYS